MENEQPISGRTIPAGISQLYNSVPSKVQPWMQPDGGIPARAKACAEVDSTHGIQQGSWLIMGNAPVGLKPKD